MRGNCSRSPSALPALALALSLAAGGGCAPTVETPADAAYRRDLRDAERITAQLQQLPRVRSAHVTLTRPAADPLRAALAPNAPAAPSASVVLVLDPAVRRTDTASSPSSESAAAPEPAAAGGFALPSLADVRALVTGVAPEVAAERVAVVARPAMPPIELRKVGPFEVTEASRRPLLAALLVLLALAAALGATLAMRERHRRAADRSRC